MIQTVLFDVVRARSARWVIKRRMYSPKDQWVLYSLWLCVWILWINNRQSLMGTVKLGVGVGLFMFYYGGLGVYTEKAIIGRAHGSV